MLRATILQSTHRFAEARADLDLLLSIDRHNAQALLTRATVLQVQGNFDEAKKSCAQLYGIATDLIVRTCLASASNVSGGARASYASLKSALKSSTQAAPDVQIWALTLLAEMASRMGNTAAAEMHFKDAFSLTRTDSYLLGAYADFLLNAGRYTAVVALLKDQTRADALLLRYALALDALRAPEALHAVSILRDRFEASLLRGDTVHQREQSRFELQLMKNPTRALQLAQANWMVQKEPADARILLEAAVGAADKSAAQPLLAWLSASGMEDVTLDRLKIALAKLP